MQALKTFLRASAFVLCAITGWSATINIAASTAANISDYHEEDNGSGGFIIVQDGDGDQFSTAFYPYLAAGMNLSGASGQNGTARFQIEFDISSLAGMNVTSAKLVMRTNANLMYQDTRAFFYHVTGDEDGVTTVTDFQSPAVYTGLFQDPIAADAVLEYDVTSFVLADVLGAKMFSSFQGRSSEDPLVEDFRQTLEFLRSTPADPNVGPVLVVEAAPIPEPGTFAVAGCAIAAIACVRKLRVG